MARITIASVTAQLEASHVSYQRLLGVVDTMALDLAAVSQERDRLVVALAAAPAARAVSPARAAYLAREVRGPSEAELAFKAKCAAARAAAMAGNTSVRV